MVHRVNTMTQYTYTCDMCDIKLRGKSKDETSQKIRQHLQDSHGLFEVPDNEIERREAMIQKE